MSARPPLLLIMGKSVPAVLDRVMQDISQRVQYFPVAICTDTHRDGISLAVARLIRERVRHGAGRLSTGATSDLSVRIAMPENGVGRLFLRPVRGRTTIQSDHPGVALSHVTARSAVANASSLVGVVTIPVPEPRRVGPLAIGMWTRFIEPKIAWPLLFPTRRERRTADVASLFQLRVRANVVINETKGYVVLMFSTDLIAAELAGLALLSRSHDSAVAQVAPWEDPVVQRATEFDLGVTLPDDILLRPLLAIHKPDDRDLTTFADLGAVVRARLGIAVP